MSIRFEKKLINFCIKKKQKAIINENNFFLIAGFISTIPIIIWNIYTNKKLLIILTEVLL